MSERVGSVTTALYGALGLSCGPRIRLDTSDGLDLSIARAIAGASAAERPGCHVPAWWLVLPGMRDSRPRPGLWLAAAVIGHTGLSIAHGAAHAGAHVPLSRPATLFVYVVILAAPLIGLALTWGPARLGGWVIALSLAGALAFGIVNHFVIVGPDHVAHVDAAWRPLFAATAVLLAATEAAGAGLAIAFARERKRS